MLKHKDFFFLNFNDNSCSFALCIIHPGKTCVPQMMFNGPCTTTVHQPVHGKSYKECVLPEKNQISLRICKLLLKSFMDALWVAKDTTVKRTAKTGHCTDVPTDLGHLCSVGVAAFRLKWIGVGFTSVVLTRDPFSKAIYFHFRTKKFPRAN